MDYREAGVNIKAGEELVRRIAPLVRSTYRKEVLGDLGGFGGLFELSSRQYVDPVLVSGTDGVGTKLKIAFMLDQHDTIGIDLVAMCVNDILVSGAEPLFFLDYLAVGQLSVAKGESIVKGMVEGCRQAGCALIGGETAEMPSMYNENEYELAGFAVGVVERANIINGSKIQPGDAVVGFASTGLHSNGYSLVRRILFDQNTVSLDDRLEDSEPSLGEMLLTPTRIYVKSILILLKEFRIHGMAHITGGGLTENIPRILPQGCQAEISLGSWDIPLIFSFLERLGSIDVEEMYRVFNMGIGFVLVVPADQAPALVSRVGELGEKGYIIGQIVQSVETNAGVAYKS